MARCASSARASGSSTGPSIDRELPTVGEHTDEILGKAGYTPAEIEELRRDGVI